MFLSDDVIDDAEDVMATEEAADSGIPNAELPGLETRQSMVTHWEGGREGVTRIRDLDTCKHYKVRGASFRPGADRQEGGGGALEGSPVASTLVLC